RFSRDWSSDVCSFDLHFFGDFVFQTRKIVQNKKKPVYFLAHIAIHAFLLCVFLFNDNMWWAIIFVVLFHALFDWLKLKLTKKIRSEERRVGKEWKTR